ncbi:hypothetical protein JXB12_03970 [candidate division KSB1 bacterium]|nr:hypothetical protein [candidate division KSB1 bacterium]
MNRKKNYVIAILLTIVLVISGCFEYQERLVLKQDASGTMEVDMWFNKDLNIEDDNYNLSQEKDEMEREIREKYTSEKVKLIKYDMVEQDDKKHVNFQIAFPHILDLNEIKQFNKNKITYQKDDSRIEYQRYIYFGDHEEDGDSEEVPLNFLSRFVFAMLEEFLQNIKFQFELETPQEIKESDADLKPSKNKAVWTFRLSQVMYDNKITISATF